MYKWTCTVQMYVVQASTVYKTLERADQVMCKQTETTATVQVFYGSNNNKKAYKKQINNQSRVEENYPRNKSKFRIGILYHRQP